MLEEKAFRRPTKEDVVELLDQVKGYRDNASILHDRNWLAGLHHDLKLAYALLKAEHLTKAGVEGHFRAITEETEGEIRRLMAGRRIVRERKNSPATGTDGVDRPNHYLDARDHTTLHFLPFKLEQLLEEKGD